MMLSDRAMASPYPLLKEIAALTLKVARPLIWHDPQESWPKPLLGGSCFILRFNEALIGVTADHVVETFEKQNTGTIALLRTVPIDLAGTIIDRNAELDIATFRVTEEQLISSEAVAIDCRRGNWPPPPPEHGSALSLGGYPNMLKNAWAFDELKTFKAFVSLARAERVTSLEITTVYDQGRGDFRAREAPEFPDLGINLSGCSGGPALLHVEHNGLHQWFPIGLIVEGSIARNDSPLYDTTRLRRVPFVNTNGTITKLPDSGWLP